MGTESNTQRKDFSKISCKEDSLIEESKKRLEEAEEENRKLFEEAKQIKKFVGEAKQHCLLDLEALGKPIDAPPPLLPPLAFGTMPSLVPLQDAVVVARQNPERGNRSPFLTPPKKINAVSLVDDYEDMTPLDHMSPAATMLNQIRYAQEHIGGNEYKNCEDKDDDKNCKYDDNNDAEEPIFGDDDKDSKDGDYKDRGEDDDYDSESVGLFGYADDDYNHLDDDDLNKDERLI